MTSLSPAARPLVLADRLVARSLLTDVALVVAGTLLVALLAQVSIPLWPVPITGQTLGVLLVGSTLGWARGASSLALYAASGIAGLPSYAPQLDGGHLTGLAAVAAPSFGYIVGFIPAAALVGALSERMWDRKAVGTVAAFALGSAVIYLVGAGWLALVLGLGFASALAAGVVPFLLGDVIKAALAAALLPGAWKLARHGRTGAGRRGRARPGSTAS